MTHPHFQVHKEFQKAKNRLNRGEVLVFEKSEQELTSPNHRLVAEIARDHQPSSVLEVGYAMGEMLANLRKVLPNAEIEGVEQSNLNASYGNNLFGLSKYNVKTHAANVMELSTNRKYDLVFCTGVLSKLSSVKAEKMVRRMIELSNKYVLVVERKLKRIPESFQGYEFEEMLEWAENNWDGTYDVGPLLLFKEPPQPSYSKPTFFDSENV